MSRATAPGGCAGRRRSILRYPAELEVERARRVARVPTGARLKQAFGFAPVRAHRSFAATRSEVPDGARGGLRVIRRPPHYFLHGNLVFGRGPRRRLGRLPPRRPELPGPLAQPKDRAQGADRGLRLHDRDRLPADPNGARVVGGRVRRAGADDASPSPWPARGVLAPTSQRQRERLAERRTVRPEVFVFVRARSPGCTARSASGSPAFGRELGERGRAARRPRARQPRARRASPARGARLRPRRRLPAVRARALGRDRLPDPLRLHPRASASRASTPNWRPQALLVEDPRAARGAFEPYEHDLLRLHESRVTIAPRALRDRLGARHLPSGAAGHAGRFPRRRSSPAPTSS